MVNSIYNYSLKDYTDELENEFTVFDYSSYYFQYAKDALAERPDLFQIIELADDDKLESLAYDYYGSENYGDLIAFVNDIEYLWGVSYNTDILYDIKTNMLDFYKDVLLINKNPADYTDEDRDKINSLEGIITDLVELENSERRKIKIPIPDKLQDVLNIISSKKIDMDTIL